MGRADLRHAEDAVPGAGQVAGGLARLTVGKYTRVRWSVDLLRVALAGTGLAAVLAALG